MFDHERYLYDKDGERIHISARGYDDINSEKTQAHTATGAGAGSPLGFILLALLLFFGWVQKMGKILPLWELFTIAAAISFGVAAFTGHWLRRRHCWSPTPVAVSRAVVFVGVFVLLSTMFYDFTGLGSKVLLIYVGIGIVLCVLAIVFGLAAYVIQHPVRSVAIAAGGGWLFWILFLAPKTPNTTQPVSREPRTPIHKVAKAKRQPIPASAQKAETALETAETEQQP